MIDRILGLIESSGMSDSAICKELALGNGIIGKWRKGIQKPSTEAIIKVATYFHVSADYLLFGHENNTSFRFSDDDIEWLSLIHQLPEEKRYEFKGELKGYLKRLNEESVAADSGSNSTGKSLA